jgi:DNA-directed RNA polymerase specialized sigma24 family protein
MIGEDWIDREDRPTLTVITGLTYLEQSQVFNRWFLPTYRTSFRWTGSWYDAEDATTWVFMNAIGHMRLPERVSVVDDQVAEATLEAASRHWSDRYGVARLRCSQIYACEAALSDRPPWTLEALVDGLSVEMRLVIALRFLRKRPLSAIAAQLGIPSGMANVHLYTALSCVAERIGLEARHGNSTQADEVAAFVDEMIGRRRPARFEAMPGAWAALLAATHLQAAIAGNDIPAARFVRPLEESFKTNQAGGSRRSVTRLRIWTA